MVHIDPGLRAFVITGLVTAGIAVTGMTDGSSREAPESRIMNPQVRELLKELRIMRATWHPREKARFEVRMREQADTWVQGVALLVEEARHSYAPDGVELLGILGTPNALNLARRIARDAHPALQPAAITAAAQIEPWPAFDLVTFLQAERETTRRAAIEAASGEADPTIQDALCVILEDYGSILAAEAAAALPDPPAAEILERMEAVVRYGPVARKAIVLEALGRPGAAKVVAPMFLRFLDYEEAEIVAMALQGLGQLQQLPDGGMELWEFAENQQKPTILRCQVLGVLEGHPLPEDSPVGLLARTGVPEVRYHAVRVMLAQGAAGGLEASLMLMREGLDSGEGTALRRAGQAARVLLQGALGTSLGATFEAIAAQLSNHTDRKRPLPTAVNLFQTTTLGGVPE